MLLPFGHIRLLNGPACYRLLPAAVSIPENDDYEGGQRYSRRLPCNNRARARSHLGVQ
jgi:hypothetical protein